MTVEELKLQAMKLSEELGSNSIPYKSLQAAMGKMGLKDLDTLVKELIEKEPGFGKINTQDTAKLGDDELVLELTKEAAPKKAKPKAKPKEKPKEEDEPEKETGEPKSIWQKFMALFGK